MKPILLGSLLKRSLQRGKLGTAVEAAMVVETAERFLNEQFGVDHDIEVVSIRAGVLSIRCRNASAKTELRLRQDELIEELNKAFHGGIVKRLRFV